MNSPLRRRAPQLLRRMLQLSVLLFVVWTSFGGAWRNYKVAHNSERIVTLMNGPVAGRAYGLNESLLSVWAEPYSASLDFLGMPWSATLFGLETADPILAMANMLTTGRVYPALIPATIVALALAALLGKVFCSHLCPARTMFELGQLVRGGLLRMGLHLPHMHVDVRVGGWVLLGGLIASMFAGTGIWFLLLPYLDVAAAIFLAITGTAATALVAIPAGWLMVDILFAPGFFCHNVCPQGFLLEQLGRISWLRLRKQPGSCPPGCQVCTMTCPYALSPREETHRPACDNCGACVRTCPDRRLARKIGLPIVTILALALFAGSEAQANHSKGLPHYGYFANYPQVPTEEYVTTDGRWEMGATIFNFQGYERAGSETPNDVKFFVYLYDLELDQNYTGRVEFEIALDGDVVSRFSRQTIDEELIYATRETLPETGDYQLIATLQDLDVPASVSMDFHIELKDGGLPWGLLLGLGGPLIPLGLLAVFGQSREGRAKRMKAQRAARSQGGGPRWATRG